ncbi:hypothetical protein ACR79H_07805 [Sphingobacterium spiritivorum]|uniref:hypothetical protein n=1 Tax=Sphingobacterium spiritivorum TaxID=258 RepID=UPI003DA406A5
MASCKKDKEPAVETKLTVNITKPEQDSSPDAENEVLIEATAVSNVELKGYKLMIKSTANNEVLYTHEETLSGKEASISHTWNYLTDTKIPVTLEMTVTTTDDTEMKSSRSFVRERFVGYDSDLGLAVSMIHYKAEPINSVDKLDAEFTITNYGAKTYKKGEKLYINSRMNGEAYQDLAFFPNRTTAHELTDDLTPGGSITIKPGYIIPSQTIPFLPMFGASPADYLEICIVVWGTTPESVKFDSNPLPTKCVSCGTYKP